MKRRRQDSGFTLVEVVVALGVFAVLVTGIVFLFGFGSNSVREVSETGEVSRLHGALEKYLTEVDFAVAYDWAHSQQGAEDVLGDTTLYGCFYRASLDKYRDDGTPEPYVVGSGGSVPGTDFQVVPSIRPEEDSRLSEDVNSRVFGLYRISLGYSSSNPTPLDELPDDVADFGQATLLFDVRYNPVQVLGGPIADPNKLPTFTATVAVMR